MSFDMFLSLDTDAVSHSLSNTCSLSLSLFFALASFPCPSADLNHFCAHFPYSAAAEETNTKTFTFASFRHNENGWIPQEENFSLALLRRKLLRNLFREETETTFLEAEKLPCACSTLPWKPWIKQFFFGIATLFGKDEKRVESI